MHLSASRMHIMQCSFLYKKLSFIQISLGRQMHNFSILPYENAWLQLSLSKGLIPWCYLILLSYLVFDPSQCSGSSHRPPRCIHGHSRCICSLCVACYHIVTLWYQINTSLVNYIKYLFTEMHLMFKIIVYLLHKFDTIENIKTSKSFS